MGWVGNVIDPLDIIRGIELEDLHAKLLTGNLQEDEIAKATKYQKSAFPSGIPECGADALRYTLVSYSTGGKHLYP
jgi:valyl-tRNA synthetase